MVTRPASALAILLGVTCCLLRTMVAQTLAPYAGLYRPTSKLASRLGLTLRQQRSVTLGMRVTKWWPGRLGIEGTLGIAPSPLLVSTCPGCNGYPAYVLTASAKALLRVTSPAARARLHLGGGVGLVGHGGDAYPPWYTGPTTFVSAIANAGARITVARWVAVRLDAEDFVYSAHIGPCTRTTDAVCAIWSAGQTLPTASVLQNDLVLSLGLVLHTDSL